MWVCSGTLDGGVDLLVVGSGGAGLTAALAALDAGARVAVLEKAAFLGGTTALSGGMVWVPCSRVAREAGHDDSPERALGYTRTITQGRARDDLLRAHLDRGPALLEFLEEVGGLRYTLIGTFPDYHPELEGGSEGGRSLEPELYDCTALGPLQALVRPDPRPPFAQREYFEVWKTLANFPWDELERRREQGIASRGRALVAPLVKAIADRGGTLAVDARVERLLVEDGRVVGVRVAGRDLRCGLGVVLASGGFEWSDELCTRFLSGPVLSRCSAPTNVGDGLRMAMAVGADLAGMSEAWWGTHVDVPGPEVDGVPVGTMLTLERGLPGSIVVNRRGERFTNEAGSYYPFGKSMGVFDGTAYGYRNSPSYLVADHTYFERYGVLGHAEFETLPDWVTTAPSLPALAAKLGVDPDGLVATVERFNGFAVAGHDPDFRRGETAYNRYFGDAGNPHPNPNLAPLEQGPYLAFEIKCGAFGTKGGVNTDVDGRALDPWGEPIEGLFAVGNVSAHPIAFGYMGAGSTLGPAMTMARAAGVAAAAAAVAR